ncbi:D-alanyl-D-alanine carboxypeptidase family protein [Chachezhania sediminis]|uniref:D-alanyl-D-alanine carboxypeptidase family protein n=1 Tax=Chachezhania sediminis TaxID=2599291 RepID=UPI00131E2E3E
MVMDARTGKVLYSKNAEARLHPASLTKMMTLYIAFDAVQRGEISLDTKVTISKHAAAEPPSKLGMVPGQKIALRYLIRAAAVKSANDAATAIGEAIAGNEAAFAARMNRTAKALGMKNTTFKNANGLTQSGHLSTAEDMTILGRRMVYDFPQYYNIFSRESTYAGIKTVNNTNRRFLKAYRGADGIKTGYTNAAGFNLVGSAKRGNERIIATVFGGTSTANRNAKVMELLDLGFRKAPSNVRERPPEPVALAAVAKAKPAASASKVSGAVGKSLRPKARAVLVAAADPAPAAPPPVVTVPKAALAEALKAPPAVDSGAVADAVAVAQAAATTPIATPAGTGTGPASAVADAGMTASLRPVMRPATQKAQVTTVAAAAAAASTPDTSPDVVTRMQADAGRHWGINVGRYTSRAQAEKVLLRTALTETGTLDGSLRQVVQGPRGYDATFTRLTRDSADLACRRLQARNVTCFMMGPI